MAEELKLITDALIKGQANRVKTLTEVSLENNIDAITILEAGLLPGMNVISEKFRNNIIFIPDVMTASRAMHAGLHVLKPYLSAGNGSLPGRIVFGTVAGDLHDIGKNLVVMMLRGTGLEVIDLGVDVHPEDFAEAVEEYQPKILAMSALLTTTMTCMAETIRELESRGLRDDVKVIIGGGPVTKDYAQVIKADGYSSDAMSAVDVVKEIMSSDVSA